MVCDNGGYAVINRLQVNTGGAEFNNLLSDDPSRALLRRSTSSSMRSRWARSPSASSRVDDLERRSPGQGGRPQLRHRRPGRPVHLDGGRRLVGGRRARGQRATSGQRRPRGDGRTPSSTSASASGAAWATSTAGSSSSPGRLVHRRGRSARSLIEAAARWSSPTATPSTARPSRSGWVRPRGSSQTDVARMPISTG